MIGQPVKTDNWKSEDRGEVGLSHPASFDYVVSGGYGKISPGSLQI